MVNDLRVVYNRVSGSALQENIGTSLNRRVGLPDLSDDPRTWGLSLISVTGYGTLGDEFNNPQDSTLGSLHVSDAMTWTRGAHLVKLGVDLRFTRQDAFRDVQSRGFLNFSNNPGITGNALADLLLGLPITTGGATPRQPAAAPDPELQPFHQRQLPTLVEHHPLGRAALRDQRAAGRRRRSREHL